MPSSYLPLQIAAILATVMVLHAVMRPANQPLVVAELAAGIVLGPLFLGKIAPNLQVGLFGVEAVSSLKALGDVGLILFMFTAGSHIGLPSKVQWELRAATCIGTWSFAVPTAIGIVIGNVLFASFAPMGTSRGAFVIFMGCAFGATALPVLARILNDLGLLNTDLGRISLAAAAVVDALAWAFLSVVTALAVRRTGVDALIIEIVAMALSVTLLVTALRLVCTKLRQRSDMNSHFAAPTVLFLMLFVFVQLGAWCGTHPALGAFIFGLCVPREITRAALVTDHLERVNEWLLLPIFFAVAGLDVGGVGFTSGSLVVAILIFGSAILSKAAGVVLGGRIAGQCWRTVAGLACLMNTRGLMEVVIARIGLDAGIIDHGLFTILILLALVTTAMTSPLMALMARITGKEGLLPRS